MRIRQTKAMGTAACFLLTALFLPFFHACTDTQYTTEQPDEQNILFGVDDIDATRGDQITNDAGSNPLMSMAVFCAHTDQKKFSEDAAVFNWMYNAEVKRDGLDKAWITTDPALSGTIANTKWAGNGYHTFMAFAPYGVEGVTYSPAANAAGLPQMTYTVPVIPAVPAVHREQVDLLYSAKTLVDGQHMYVGGHPVSFGMQHALSKISFSAALKTGTSGIKIKQIEVAGVNSKGTFAYDLGVGTPNTTNVRWESPASPETYPLSVANGEIQDAVLQNDPTYTSLTPDGKGAFLLPQTLPDNAKLKITLVDVASGYEFIREYALKAITPQWEPGKAYQYKIQYDGAEIICFVDVVVTPWDNEGENIDLGVKLTPVFNIASADNFTYSYLGKNASFTVESYGTTEQGTKVNIPWIVEYETAPGSNVWTTDKPAILKSPIANGTGSQTPVACDIQVEKQNVRSILPNTVLQIPEKGTITNPYDLSTKGGSSPMNTANCYVVNGPGYYKFPVVYGNGIKNGSPNSSAYSGSSDNAAFISYPNHLNQKISDPKITLPNPSFAQVVMATRTVETNYGHLDQSLTPYSSASNSVIKDVTLLPVQPDGYSYIRFRVDASNIRECAVQIALTMAGSATALNSGPQSVWSWNIWVSPYDFSTDDVDISTNTTSPVYMMSVPLGRINGLNKNVDVYDRRTQRVRFTQTGIVNPVTRIITIRQAYANLSTFDGTCSYYQWGRKDPFFYKPDKYDDAGSYYSKVSAGVALSSAILNPYKFYASDHSSWFQKGLSSTRGVNILWNNNGSKTIYDPCPAGYKMPTANILFDGVKAGVITYNMGDPYYQADCCFKSQDITRFHARGYYPAANMFKYKEQSELTNSTSTGEELFNSLVINASTFGLVGRWKVDAVPVRCIREP